jgi:hypothetical protein
MGVKKAEGGKGYKDWYKVECKSCKLIKLGSGDCLLFQGSPEANVAHGSLGDQNTQTLNSLGRSPYDCPEPVLANRR